MTRPTPLEERFRALLDDVARARGYPTSHDVAALGRAVGELSALYNDTSASAVRAGTEAALAARLAFSFPRDVPKGEAATRELVALDALPIEQGRLSVLDLGAGLGAMTWGLARALDRAGREVTLDVELVDRDTGALALAQRILSAESRMGRVTLAPRYTPGGAGVGAARAPVGLVILGQILSELDRDRDEDARVARHAELLTGLVHKALVPGGALVVVEPALRDRTRHLHRVRDAVLASGGVHVFAPCTHDAPCPALVEPTDWCHEDLAVDLPSWLVPVARAAGLRYQGLTFSYLVLRADARSVGERASLRVVSEPRRTKGKRELFVCGRLAPPAPPGRVRAMRLDRERAAANADWEALGRGDLLELTPPLDARGGRLPADAVVKKVDVGETRQ